MEGSEDEILNRRLLQAPGGSMMTPNFAVIAASFANAGIPEAVAAANSANI